MPGEKSLKLKLCLIGEGHVGKTSLIKRYVFDEFTDKYISTIGTKVTKKEITVSHPNYNGPVEIQLMIWDIMGQQGFRQLLQDSYFFGAQGLIGVCDVTRKNTLSELNNWMDAVQSVTGDLPAIFLGNKSDLEDWQEIHLKDLKIFSTRYNSTEAYLSSAKTGENVETAFKNLTEKVVEGINKEED
jgi:small GTP-binding protein